MYRVADRGAVDNTNFPIEFPVLGGSRVLGAPGINKYVLTGERARCGPTVILETLKKRKASSFVCHRKTEINYQKAI